jgi:small subunit ribosomal protein S7
MRQLERYHKAKTDEARAEIELNPMTVFLRALDNCKPILKLITVTRGGINYSVPVPMSEKEREFKAANLIISSVGEKDKEARFYDKLANELIEASLNQGKAIKKKIDIHKAAESNRAYAHFRWTKG